MTTDRTTKLLLALIALALFLNALLPLVQPESVAAQVFPAPGVAGGYQTAMWMNDVLENLSAIADGTCSNPTIC